MNPSLKRACFVLLAALTAPSVAFALPVEAVQRSIQQRWAAVNDGTNCTFPQRSDGANPGPYPADGFYGADLEDAGYVAGLIADLENKVFNYLTHRYVLFSEIEGTQLGITYNYYGGDYLFDVPADKLVSAVALPASPGSSFETRLKAAEEALKLCQHATFWLIPYTAQVKGSEAITYGPDCYTPPSCGSSYGAASASWAASAWSPLNVTLSTDIFGEEAGGGIEGGMGGSCFNDRVDLYTRTGKIDVNIGDSPGDFSFYVAVSPFGGTSLPTCPVAADSNWHLIDNVSGNGLLSSRYIPVDPAANGPPPALPGCPGFGGWFVYVCGGIFHGHFTDDWAQSSHTKDNDRKLGGNQCDDLIGMARYSAHAMLASLNIKDTPLRYFPPRGPAVDLTVTYNQRANELSTATSYSNLGTKWTCNWLAHVADDPNTQLSATTVYLGDGGAETFAFDPVSQTFAPDAQSHSVLVRTTSNTYERRLSDGSKQVFGPQSNGATAFPRLLLLTRMTDPAGNAVTVNYDGSDRVASVTDAIGQSTTFSYELPGDSFKITKVTDPFGRYAVLDYTNGQLTRITDPVGIQSQIGYASGTDFINSLMTPYGMSTFATGESDTSQWVEMTDPLGGKERVEYRDNAPGISGSDPAGLVPAGFTNAKLAIANTFYWDKKATLMFPPVGGVYDYTKARIMHWTYDSHGSLSGIVASEKAPLENRIWNAYAGQSDTNHSGPSANPTQIARVLGDGTTQLSTFQYNSLGKTTQAIDPVGRSLTYVYGSNKIDLLEVRQTTGTSNELLRKFTYNSQHEPLTDTDAAGQATTYTYNGYGQMLTRKNAKNETTTFTYGGSVPAGYLASISSPLFNGASAVTSFSYDTSKRVQTVTDSDGYAVTIDYDNLDRKTKVTYPDGSYQQFQYTDNVTGTMTLDLTTSRDRRGLSTYRHYNANEQMDSIKDPANKTTLFGWCGCGALENITDQKQQTTTFLRDLQGRVYQKVFPDNTTINYLYDGQAGPNAVGASSRLQSSTDAKGQRTNYTYFADNNIQRVSYTDTSRMPLTPATPSANFAYDPKFNRVTSMVDGIGSTVYAYKPINVPPVLGAGQLASIDGPLANDTITFTYDELGRVINRKIDGGTNSETWAFDSLGRVSSDTNKLGIFTYSYVGVTERLSSMGYPNGATAGYTYFPNTQDKRLQQIKNLTSTSASLSQFDYTYDLEGQIMTWSKNNPSMTGAQRYDLGYDNADQLLTAPLKDAATNALITQYTYGYDAAANRTSEQVANKTTTFSPNNVNEITSQTNPKRTLAHDANGSLTYDGHSRTFEWDAANRLVAINYSGTMNRTELSYDGLNRLAKMVEKTSGAITSTSKFVWCGTEKCEVRNANDGVSFRTYPQGQFDTGTAYFYTRDHLGSVREMLKSDGTLVARYDYDPWGRSTAVLNTVKPDANFTGLYRHSKSDLLFAAYRAYDPDLGRWLSRDPIQEQGGVNLYAYVLNDPARYSDTLGWDLDVYLDRDYADRRAPGTYKVVEDGTTLYTGRANENPFFPGSQGVRPGDYLLLQKGDKWGPGRYPSDQPAITGRGDNLKPGQPNDSYTSPALIHEKGVPGRPDSRACITVDPAGEKIIKDALARNLDSSHIHIREPSPTVPPVRRAVWP